MYINFCYGLASLHNLSIYCQVFYRYEESYKFLTKYCGTWDPFSVVILSSKGAFRMISDSSYESKGFRAEFSAIKEREFSFNKPF